MRRSQSPLTRILLVPPPNIENGAPSPYVPLGLLSLQAVANEAGGDVDLFFWPEALLIAHATASSEALSSAAAESIDTDRYSVVGLSTMCSSFHHSLNIARALKRRSPRTRIWLGGPQASVAPRRVLEAFPEIEAVFVGEGEATFRELLERQAGSPDLALAGLPGVCVRGVRFVPRPRIRDLDSLPFLDRAPGFLPSVTAAGRSENPDYIPVEAERGCPGRCTFCSTRLFWGNRVRRKTDARLIAELRRLQKLTNADAFCLMGDNLASPHHALMRFCAAARDQVPELRWHTSLKLDRLRVSDLDALWDGGCRGFFVGLESASQDTLDRTRKDADLQRELEVVYAAVERGFSVDTSLIIGFPWETEDDIRRTYNLHAQLLRHGVKRSLITVLSPLPGTHLQREYADRIVARAGLSKAALDDVPYGPETVEMMDHCPELFTQLGYFPTGAERTWVAAVAGAAGMLASHHADKRKKAAAGAGTVDAVVAGGGS